MKHCEENKLVPAAPEDVFAFIDNHANFSSHMSKSSWMMGGGSMDVSIDEGHGRRIGSHIRLQGTAFGMKLYLDEVVTQYDPPKIKNWKTVGDLNLLVIGHYIMGVEIKPQDSHSLVRVYIDFDLPKTNVWVGRIFGNMYAKWCVKQMTNGIHTHFTRKGINKQ